MKTNAYNQMTSEELIRHIQQNKNNELWGELYLRNYKSIYYLVLKYLKNRDDAYDLTQEILFHAYQKIEELREPAAFHSWLYRLAINRCSNFLREKKIRFRNEVDYDFDLSARAGSPEEESGADRKLQMLEALDNGIFLLRSDLRKLVEQKYFSEYSLLKLGQEYQLRESAVKMRLARARRHLKKYIEGNVALP